MFDSRPKLDSHPIFGDLKEYIAFYERLSFTVFGWVTHGTGAACNIDSYLYSSIQGTLSSIEVILRAGRVNDAYTLLRKYFDSATINIYSMLYLDDHFSIENFIVKQIDGWLKGKEKLPAFRVMRDYIRSSAKVEPITSLLSSDDRYARLRERCNDHTHYNFYKNVLLNDNEIHLPGRGPAIDQFQMDIRDVFVFHMGYIFFIRDNYMMASDYVDALEVGLAPEPDSQYWVAPFIQRMFDETMTKNRPDIVKALREWTCMQLS